MTVLLDEPGALLVKQYGYPYVRFMSAYSQNLMLQQKITDAQLVQLQNFELPLKQIARKEAEFASHCPEALQSSLILDYLIVMTDYSGAEIAAILDRLKTNDDIFQEFHQFVMEEDLPAHGLAVEGYTAKDLIEQYPISPLGAYNYLMYLRTAPANTLHDLEKSREIIPLLKATLVAIKKSVKNQLAWKLLIRTYERAIAAAMDNRYCLVREAPGIYAEYIGGRDSEIYKKLSYAAEQVSLYLNGCR